MFTERSQPLPNRPLSTELPFRKTLRFKLFASYCVLLLLTVIATLLVHAYGMQKFFRYYFREDIQQLAQQTQIALEEYLESNPDQPVEGFLLEANRSPLYRVRFVSLEDPSKKGVFRLTDSEWKAVKRGQLVAGEAKERTPKFRLPLLPRPGEPARKLELIPQRFVATGIEVEQRVVGALVLFDFEQPYSAILAQLSRSVTVSLSFVIAFSIIAAYLLSRHLTRPIKHIERAVSNFSQGQLSTRTGLERSDEIGRLARGFDQMASEIEGYTATRTRLLNDISHELGTPVSTIRVTMEAIYDNLIDPSQHQQFLQSSLNQLKHLSHIVNDVTELARFESGQISIRKERLEASLPAARAVEATRALADRKNIDVQLLPAEEQLYILGDRHRLIQVMKNLVVNAIHHNPAGTKVVVSWKARKGTVLFQVSDDGPPLTAEDQARIFDRFYKASKSRARDDSRSGLGLAIVRRILLLHDCDIKLVQKDSRKIFQFAFPAQGQCDDGH